MLHKKAKFIVALSIFSIIFFSFWIHDSNAVQQKILIYLNGKQKTDWDPQFINGRVYVPVKLIAESLGSKVDWDDNKRTVDINTDIKMIASIPEEEIYLYALNKDKNNNMYKDLIVSMNGVKKVFDWETIAKIEDLPQLHYLDLNHDQKKELVIILSKGHGTGFSSKTIHVVNPENFTEYHVENPLDIIKNNVTTKIISDNEVEIKIGETVSHIKLKDIPFELSQLSPEKISKISYENYIDYEISSNTIKVIVGVEGDYLKYIGDIKIEYDFTDSKFKMKDISFKKTSVTN
ncbi:copper amine oxidase N-terminal domain-containing protein [Brevibacillus parabrevis]|jgi:Copper amine oxidase N-terminal domain.|uniref:copper amine oxidase N-terminal domain-containing protein n=1 Tax=Brevibacillus parabrevis TaxID=54914 RepID=UPI0024909939|nr:copper amine oxidase N-terminal domain-containing protein [Brevibacillus parabrevis]